MRDSLGSRGDTDPPSFLFVSAELRPSPRASQKLGASARARQGLRVTAYGQECQRFGQLCSTSEGETSAAKAYTQPARDWRSGGRGTLRRAGSAAAVRVAPSSGDAARATAAPTPRRAVTSRHHPSHTGPKLLISEFESCLGRRRAGQRGSHSRPGAGRAHSLASAGGRPATETRLMQ